MLNTYCDCQWLRVLLCIDGKPCHAIAGSDALHLIRTHHHFHAFCRSAIRIHNFKLPSKKQIVRHSEFWKLTKFCFQTSEAIHHSFSYRARTVTLNFCIENIICHVDVFGAEEGLE